MEGKRYFIKIEFNGADFHGWQRQLDRITVQEAVETALFHLLREEIEVVGCGRTDAEVNANEFFAHFDSMPIRDPKALVDRLNRYFQYNIRVLDVFEVGQEAHSRFDAVSRTYKYYIATQKQPFYNEFSYFIPRPLDIELMKEASKLLIGRKDFQAFSKVNTDVSNFFSEIYEADWEVRDGLLVFTIRANRFLRNMVRAIVGTLIEVGLGKLSVKDFEKVIESKDRCNAGSSVPGKALFLHKVEYPYNTTTSY